MWNLLSALLKQSNMKSAGDGVTHGRKIIIQINRRRWSEVIQELHHLLILLFISSSSSSPPSVWRTEEAPLLLFLFSVPHISLHLIYSPLPHPLLIWFILLLLFLILSSSSPPPQTGLLFLLQWEEQWSVTTRLKSTEPLRNNAALSSGILSSPRLHSASL